MTALGAEAPARDGHPGPVIRLTGLSKRFGSGTASRPALDDVSFDVGQGEVVALLGLSGSGKSTLLAQLDGLQRPTAGTGTVLGTDLAGTGDAGVRLTAFASAVAVDGEFTEAYTVWLDTGRSWWAHRDQPVPYRTSGREELSGAALSMLRPHTAKPGPAAAWRAAASRAARVRILSTTCLEAALVAEGATDAFADACSDTHRLVDLAAAAVMVPRARGVVLDARGRPVVFDTDLTRRWSGIIAATPELADVLTTAADSVTPAPAPDDGS